VSPERRHRYALAKSSSLALVVEVDSDEVLAPGSGHGSTPKEGPLRKLALHPLNEASGSVDSCLAVVYHLPPSFSSRTYIYMMQREPRGPLGVVGYADESLLVAYPGNISTRYGQFHPSGSRYPKCIVHLTRMDQPRGTTCGQVLRRTTPSISMGSDACRREQWAIRLPNGWDLVSL